MLIEYTRMSTQKQPKTTKEYFCKICNFITSKKSNYDSHLLTAKHKLLTSNNNVNKQVSNDFICLICSKIYQSRVGLWSHKKKCISEKPTETINPQHTECNILDNPLSNTSLILNILQENKEFKNLLIEQHKENKENNKLKDLLIEQHKENKEIMNKMVEITQNQVTIQQQSMINSNNNNVTNNNNQTFNLNLFLNETCKDAMSIQEFLQNIRITFEDLLTIGNSGFVAGVSDILIKQLRDLDVSKRPIHCTDSKRETMYLKENEVWNKDDKDKTKLKQIIEKIEYRNVVALRDWCNENPDAKVNNTPNNLLKDKIYLQTLQGDDKTRDKIIRNISKYVIVDKENRG